VTFGCFNNPAKMSDGAIRHWAAVLAAVPGSRLLLKAKGFLDAEVRRQVTARLARLGVEPGRLELAGWQPDDRAHLESYARVDVALDAWPYNGATTTCEALWQGVPVITRAGDTHASRMGASILAAAGFPEWVADAESAFAARAAALVSDRAALAQLRWGLRDRLVASALLVAARFATGMEAALRAAWAARVGADRPTGPPS
jgi:predicted O-linked N-acetylglucosamine transferase (SPINDLY family)